MSNPAQALEGQLITLYLDEEEAQKLHALAEDFASWDLDAAQLGMLELLLDGALSPLTGYMGQNEYEGVLRESQLPGGIPWPWTISLQVSEDFASGLNSGDLVPLRDAEGVLIAVLELAEQWRPDLAGDARRLQGPNAKAADLSRPVALGGRVYGINRPTHYDFPQFRNSPQQMQEQFAKLGWPRVLAYHSGGQLLRPDFERSLWAARRAETNLLLQPCIGDEALDDAGYFTKLRCYEHLLTRYPEHTTAINLLPLPSFGNTAREAGLNAIIARNHGCSHYLLEAEKVSVTASMQALSEYWGIEFVAAPPMGYDRRRDRFIPAERGNTELETLPAEDLSDYLDSDSEPPTWYAFPEVVAEMRRTWPPRHRQGFTVFFTGLSGSGKSTIANALMVKLLELGGRPVTLLDGDLVRKHLSSELGFSKEHRDINIRRIGYVAQEITKNGGIAICAPIAPYRQTRRDVRSMISAGGGFIEIHVATSLEVCESRDRKGLYKMARAGKIKEFTGISDPYETPENPEVVIQTTDCTPGEAAGEVILKLKSLGYLR